MYSRSGRRMSKRSYIDVGFYPGSTDDKDPVELFVCMVRNRYKKGTEKVQKLNKELLEDLISKRTYSEVKHCLESSQRLNLSNIRVQGRQRGLHTVRHIRK